MQKRVWKIRGYEGIKKVFESTVPIHHLSEGQIRELLSRLAARNLTEREIVDSSLNRRARTRISLLEVQKDGPQAIYYIDGLIHYSARIVEEA